MMKNRKRTFTQLTTAVAKSSIILLITAVFFIACTDNQSEPPATPSKKVTVSPLASESASPTPTPPFVFDENNPDYREAMRQWVMDISRETRKVDPDFIIIPQNCSPLLTDSGKVDGAPARAFIAAIDGLGRESLCFGEGGYGFKRSEKSRIEIAERLYLAETLSLSVLSIDYCKQAGQIDISESFNAEYGFAGFAAADIELTEIPELAEARSHADNINQL
ncbi:MAG: hypothetical protein AB1Z19_05375, partial [Eubacteriales bacterium]